MKNLIYILDDSEIVCEMLKFSIDSNNEHFHSQFFTSTEKFKDSIVSKKPHLLVLDYHLDGGFNKNSSENAFQILEFLKQNNMHVPIVIFSGQKDKEIEKRLVNIGVSSYVSKNSNSFIDDVLIEINKALISGDRKMIN